MCPIKTENCSLNVPRAEARFWRRLAFDLKARSRGELQKVLLLLGLEKLNRQAAYQLAGIRGLKPKFFKSPKLILNFCGRMTRRALP